jgi:hypothetical protein
MAMAIGASVTVSMAEDSSGMFSRMLCVTIVLVSADVGMTLDAAGTKSTSSNVYASRIFITALLLLVSRLARPLFMP